ncbi:MAG: preprotein translocase subunit SecE [Bacilli bacterium]
MAKEKDNKSKKTVKKTTKKSKPKKVVKESYLKRVGKELKLVKWPTAKEVFKYTISTIVFCAFLCVIFMFLNLIMSLVRGWVA